MIRMVIMTDCILIVQFECSVSHKHIQSAQCRTGSFHKTHNQFHVHSVGEGRRSGAVSLHHLLSPQLTAESLITTPSQGESPITAALLSLPTWLRCKNQNQSAVNVSPPFHSPFFPTVLVKNKPEKPLRQLKRCSVCLDIWATDGLSEMDKWWQNRNRHA